MRSAKTDSGDVAELTLNRGGSAAIFQPESFFGTARSANQVVRLNVRL
jgi:hypothetical protein